MEMFQLWPFNHVPVDLRMSVPIMTSALPRLKQKWPLEMVEVLITFWRSCGFVMRAAKPSFCLVSL